MRLPAASPTGASEAVRCGCRRPARPACRGRRTGRSARERRRMPPAEALQRPPSRSPAPHVPVRSWTTMRRGVPSNCLHRSHARRNRRCSARRRVPPVDGPSVGVANGDPAARRPF